MDQLRTVFATIRKQLGGLGVSQKLLIAAVAVIMLMSLLLVSIYSGAASMRPVASGATSEEQSRIIKVLQGSGIRAVPDGDSVMVPSERVDEAKAKIVTSGEIQNTALLFQNILEKQSWTWSKEQSRQAYTYALQNELARLIASFTGVRSATVILDIPERQNLGQAVPKPSAMATVFTKNGQPLSQETVDAVANLIAGSRAGLEVDRVRVIDGTSRQQRRASTDQARVPTKYIEHQAMVEQQTRDKILELLGYVPGVMVAVTAQVDVTQLTAEVQRFLPRGAGTEAPVRRELATTSNQSDRTGGSAEPGVRSNTQADLASSAGGAGSTTTQTTEESEFDPHVGSRREMIVDPRGMATSLAASINIPRGYIAALVRQSKASAAGGANAAGGADAALAEPTEDEIAQRFEAERQKIEASVMPHVTIRGVDATGAATTTAGTVVVSMTPIDVAMPGMPGFGAPGSAGFLDGLGGSGSIIAMGGGLIERVVLVGLAALAVGMMFGLVKKAGKKPPMPTVEELVGLPPKLRASSDVVGEADESETAMAGIELEDSDIKSRKILEQVTELVKSNPETAAKLVNRWIAVEQ